MAKVTGPLMSLDASGSVGKTITFSKWKGRNYVRQLTIPANPRTAGQLVTRIILGGIAKAAAAVLTSTKDNENTGSLFFITARDTAPSGQSWISYLQTVAFNTSAARAVAWGEETNTVKGYFETAAKAIGLVDYVPSYTDDLGESAGQQLYTLAYFASEYLSGGAQSAAVTARVGANLSDVEAFADIVALTLMH